MNRNQQIVRTSFIGIAVNVLLAGFKFVIGLISNSIAITLDAINNLSDALSSVITIIGAKFASKKPDKKHPFGHGRVEYMSAAIISAIVLYAGITSMVESVKKIITPELPEYSGVTLMIVAVAVAVKFLLGRYFIGTGKKIQSDSLVISGKDAQMDSLVSLSTLVAAVIFIAFNISAEAYLGGVIAILMMKSGIDMLRETVSQILGERPDIEKVREVKRVVNSFPEVSGAYDLVLHNYGPDYLIGSVHIEVSEKLSIRELDKLEREISDKVYEECAVVLAGIGIYSKNAGDDEASKMQNEIRKVVMSHDYILQMHGFYLNTEAKTVQFDVVVSFDSPNRDQTYAEVVGEIQKLYPDYFFRVGFDSDLSD